MKENPSDLKYSKYHDWAKAEGKIVTLGITEHAQESLGDIVFVELPKEGDRVVATEPYGSVESVKEGTSAGGYCGYTVHNIICTCVQEKGK